MTCAECGKEIEVGETYLEVEDNFLQAKYFDTHDDCIFCSEQCLKMALTVVERMNDGDVG